MGIHTEQIVKVLGGHRSNDGWLCRCPVRGHGKGNGDQRPSLSIKDGATALLVKCFAGCDSRDVLDELRRRALLDAVSANHPPSRSRASPLPTSPSDCWEPPPNTKALRLWISSTPIISTAGEIYLRKYRGLMGPYPPTIRFRRVLNERTGIVQPAILAAVARPDRKISAVQITFLTEDGRKAPIAVSRVTLGKLGTGAVRLAAAENVLGLAEGLETALAAMELFAVPCWATLGAARLVGVTIPPNVRTLHIFGDNDEAGHLAAERAAHRYSSEGLRAILRFPPDTYGDYNDVKRAEDEAAA